MALIDRQMAIDAVCMEWCGVKHQDCKHPFDVEKDDCYWCDGCETALRTLPDLPSAEPEKVLIAKVTLSEEQVREAVEKVKSETIQMLPSAEPRPRGRWINHRKDRGHHIADCDQCGGTLQWLDPDERPNFCPDCGADMREEEQDGHGQN